MFINHEVHCPTSTRTQAGLLGNAALPCLHGQGAMVSDGLFPWRLHSAWKESVCIESRLGSEARTRLFSGTWTAERGSTLRKFGVAARGTTLAKAWPHMCLGNYELPDAGDSADLKKWGHLNVDLMFNVARSSSNLCQGHCYARAATGAGAPLWLKSSIAQYQPQSQ